jgi:hypothetical protein
MLYLMAVPLRAIVLKESHFVFCKAFCTPQGTVPHNSLHSCPALNCLFICEDKNVSKELM